MKAQVSVISVILISGLIISLVGTAYMWGAPIIEKRSIITEFQTAQRFVLDLDELVLDIANTGTGRESLKMQSGVVRVIPSSASHPDNNSIILEFGVNQPMVFNATPVYLGGASFQDVLSEVGVFGEASPGIITLSSARDEMGYRLVFKLHYRELDTKTVPRKGYKILINDGGSIVSGTDRVIISFERTDTLQGQCCNGAGDLIVTHVKVEAV